MMKGTVVLHRIDIVILSIILFLDNRTGCTIHNYIYIYIYIYLNLTLINTSYSSSVKDISVFQCTATYMKLEAYSAQYIIIYKYIYRYLYVYIYINLTLLNTSIVLL